MSLFLLYCSSGFWTKRMTVLGCSLRTLSFLRRFKLEEGWGMPHNQIFKLERGRLWQQCTEKTAPHRNTETTGICNYCRNSSVVKCKHYSLIRCWRLLACRLREVLPRQLRHCFSSISVESGWVFPQQQRHLLIHSARSYHLDSPSRRFVYRHLILHNCFVNQQMCRNLSWISNSN